MTGAGVRMLKDRSVQVTVTVFAVALALLWSTGVTNLRHLFDDLIAVYLLLWGAYAFLSDLPRAEIRQRFTLMTAAVLVGLGCLEIPAAVGWVDYRVLLPSATVELWTKPGYVQDRELIWVRKPFSRVAGTLARGNIGFGFQSSAGTEKHMRRKFSA